MPEVGVHEAKSHLSGLLRRVSAGEERGRTEGLRAGRVPLDTHVRLWMRTDPEWVVAQGRAEDVAIVTADEPEDEREDPT